MHIRPRFSRLALVAFLIASLGAWASPDAAFAKDKHRHKHRKHKHHHHYQERVVYAAPPVVYVPSPTCAAPRYYDTYYRPRSYRPRSGVSFSVRISNVAPSGYDYYDPYCDREYESLDRYLRHCRGHDHPYVVQVIDEDYGTPVAHYGRRNGSWVRFGVQGGFRF